MGVALTFGGGAGVAQLAEQLFCKQQVTGSIPVAGSMASSWNAYGAKKALFEQACTGLAQETWNRSQSGERGTIFSVDDRASGVSTLSRIRPAYRRYLSL